MTLGLPLLSEVTGAVRSCFDTLLASLSTYLNAMAVSTPVAFDASRFTGIGATVWTVRSGQVVTDQYAMVNTRMTYEFAIGSGSAPASTLSGTPGIALYVAIPGGRVAKSMVSTTGSLYNGAWTACILNTRAGSNRLEIYPLPIAALGTGDLRVQGQISFEVL